MPHWVPFAILVLIMLLIDLLIEFID